MPKQGKRVIVTSENDTGRNLEFKDIKDGTKMNRTEFVRAINKGIYVDYYVKKMNGLLTPVSKPNGKESDNLG